MAYGTRRSNAEFTLFFNNPYPGPNEDLLSIYRSANVVKETKSKTLRWTGHIGRIEVARSALNILTDKPTGKRLLGNPRRRWDDNIRMDLKEIGINGGN